MLDMLILESLTALPILLSPCGVGMQIHPVVQRSLAGYNTDRRTHTLTLYRRGSSACEAIAIGAVSFVPVRVGDVPSQGWNVGASGCGYAFEVSAEGVSG
jgi:hypothetical protein